MSEYVLSNKNASREAQKVYEYIGGLFGKHALSAQQESTWLGSVDHEVDYIRDVTGRYPAIRGLDYMHDDFAGVNERAAKWWAEGGIVTICWHTGSCFSGEWRHAMDNTIEDWDAVFAPGTPENDAFIAGMDKGAKALLELRDKGVPVLWRPFHEFDGKWFWWGKGGAENFVKLWRLMYDRYTNHWGLNNLIWVLGYSHAGDDHDDWYPGDEYIDVIGADSYDGGAQPALYARVREVTVTKPFAFHECGVNPTVEELKETPWAWFMTWHGSTLTESNDRDALRVLYNSDYIITKDELPSFTE